MSDNEDRINLIGLWAVRVILIGATAYLYANGKDSAAETCGLFALISFLWL